MKGPCLKQTVTATVVTPDGEWFSSTNYCEAPQASCPRVGMPTGVGYHLCREICRQPAHAEVNAVLTAGQKARGAILYLEGHTYACDSCKAFCETAGIVSIVIGRPGRSPKGQAAGHGPTG